MKLYGYHLDHNPTDSAEVLFESKYLSCYFVSMKLHFLSFPSKSTFFYLLSFIVFVVDLVYLKDKQTIP